MTKHKPAARVKALGHRALGFRVAQYRKLRFMDDFQWLEWDVILNALWRQT